MAGRNPRVVLRDPAAEVRSCAWSPDGTLVATASNDQTARIWRSDNGHVVCELSNHSDWVRDCAFNAQGDRLATAADDRTARLWSISGRELLVMEHSGAVRKCAFHPKLDLLATVSRDGFIRVWEVHSGAEIFAVKRHDQPIESCAWAPDGTRLATASRDSTVRIWDMSRVIAHRGDPAIRLLAGIGCGLGKLSRSERNDLLLQQAPHDLHEALTQALAGSRTSEVDTPDVSELARRFRAEATVMGAALRAPLNALCQLAPSQRDPGRALHATGNHTPRSGARTGRIRTVLGWVAAALAVAAAFLLGRASR